MASRPAPPPTLRGRELLNAPSFNKGTAFTEIERKHFGLHGLLPPQIETLEEQFSRAYAAYKRKSDDLERHIYLRALQDTNEVLFYRLLLEHIEEMMPIVYTPVVARACQEFSHIYRRPRGLFISYPLREHISELLQNRPHDSVDVIVVTDGERILGIGDQGVGGLGISIGKLSLYSLIGGIHPARTLPVVLDVGTNNPERLRDPEYLGWRHERIDGAEYDAFIARFVSAVKEELPEACLQWEDFATAHARPILERYRDELLTFNDDIQGTAAVALGAILSAARVAGRKLRDQLVVFLGAGSASIGVADYLVDAMVEDGLSQAEARSRFFFVDVHGLLQEGRSDLTPQQRVYAQPRGRVRVTSGGNAGLADVIEAIDATILIGLSTVGGAFTESIVRAMAKKIERPVILPLSNPTERSEAKPEDLLAWTEGRALVATGSPFSPVKVGSEIRDIAQCNNVFIFPAVGLGVVASKARRVTDGMMLAAARALGENSPALSDPKGPLLPPPRQAREVARKVALAVGEQARREGLARVADAEELHRAVVESQWNPEYHEYVS